MIQSITFMRQAVLLACTLMFVVLASCSNANAPEAEAQRIMIEDLSATPGYAWFPLEVQEYQPQPDLIQQIAAAYNPAVHKVYIFVNPRCSCDGTQQLFPHTVRILTDAGIAESNIEIYSMRAHTDAHPYNGRIAVAELPTICFTNAGAIVGTITSEPGEEGGLEKNILTALQQ